MKTYGAMETVRDLNGVIEEPPTFVSGYAIGIIVINLIYPKLPGNVANASTYSFPVKYKQVYFDIEQLFEGSEEIKQGIIAAAVELEKEGVRAIIGACGFFAHFQRELAAAVDIPVFASSLCQLPMIKTALNPKKKIAVYAASAESITGELLAQVGTDMDRVVVQDVGGLPEFAAIRWGDTVLDNGALRKRLAEVTKELLVREPDIGAILLECSDLPPYAKVVQQASGLPVYDFNTMIDLVYHSVVQKEYFGYL